MTNISPCHTHYYTGFYLFCLCLLSNSCYNKKHMKNKSPLQLLETYFGYTEFRTNQEEIINSVLSGVDTLAIMPTGGGKSLCYQIPSLIFEGLTIVVSPLIALMEDQVQYLHKVGIEALLLNSTLDWKTYNANMDMIRQGKTKLLFCAPETLVTDRIQELLSGVEVSCLTIDEAHCISEWGHDFRPEYGALKSIRSKFPKALCLALTATATKNVRSDIIQGLGFKKKYEEFISTFNRENIYLEVVPKQRVKEGGPLKQVKDFIFSHKNQVGIVYCFSRKQVDELTDYLSKAGIKALPYHAGLSDIQRSENQNAFITDKVQVMVATLAFGMGINKATVDFVIHFDMPKSMEQYYQEIGRAGRGGQKATALLLYSYGDTRKIRFFMEEKHGKELEAAEKQLKAMVDYCQARSCRRQLLLSYFGEIYQCDNRIHSKNKDEKNHSCCDICSTGKGVDIDVTIPAQKLLSCVFRTGERYGTSYVVDVLLGSRQQRILENGHEKLSTWGIGTEYAKEDWFELTRLLLEAGFLAKSSDYAVLSITRDGKASLVDRALIMLPFVPSGKVSKAFSQIKKRRKRVD